MPTVKLPDGSQLEVAEGTTVAEVANRIGSRLAQAAVAARLSGKLVDLGTRLDAGAAYDLEILTDKSDEALSILRHSTAHVMAAAVRRLYGPATRFGIGPSIEDGFYYDFDLAERIADEDLAKIETEMAKIIAERTAFQRETVAIGEARRRMEADGQWCKVELLNDIASNPLRGGEQLADAEAKPEAAETVTLYRTGDFVDLCRGPHIPDAWSIPAF